MSIPNLPLQSKQEIFQKKKEDLRMFNLATLPPNSLSIAINYPQNTTKPSNKQSLVKLYGP